MRGKWPGWMSAAATARGAAASSRHPATKTRLAVRQVTPLCIRPGQDETPSRPVVWRQPNTSVDVVRLFFRGIHQLLAGLAELIVLPRQAGDDAALTGNH